MISLPAPIILGALISFYGGVNYLIDTIKGKTKPNRVTWFFWTLALMMAFFAAIPTLIKSYLEPETESSLIFLLGINMAGITLLTINDWSFAHWRFPAYILLINMILFSLIRFKLGLLINKEKASEKTF